MARLLSQYWNKQYLFLMLTVLCDLGFDAGSWNFFESGHGKGAPDATGGVIKRQADPLVRTGCDIIYLMQESSSTFWTVHTHLSSYINETTKVILLTWMPSALRL